MKMSAYSHAKKNLFSQGFAANLVLKVKRFLNSELNGLFYYLLVQQMIRKAQGIPARE